jgi:hypothetical protein
VYSANLYRDSIISESKTATSEAQFLWIMLSVGCQSGMESRLTAHSAVKLLCETRERVPAPHIPITALYVSRESDLHALSTVWAAATQERRLAADAPY